MRISREDYFMEIACITSLRGTCNRAQVGAIIVSDDNRIISTGYNGSFPKSPHCTDIGCLMEDGHCVRTLHAEVCAVLKINGLHQDLKCYVTHHPCIHCYKVLCNVGVNRIFYLKEYGHMSEKYNHLIQEIGVFPQQILNGECIIQRKF